MYHELQSADHYLVNEALRILKKHGGITFKGTKFTFPADSDIQPDGKKAGPATSSGDSSMHPRNTKPAAINRDLVQLADVQTKMAELQNQADEARDKIRSGLQPVVVMFIDLVGSTQFKQQHQDQPEVWILRVQQFTELLNEHITKLGGQVVKYIGDEVMGMFAGPMAAQYAMTLAASLALLEKQLTEITGHDTKLKMAIDSGDVYLLEFEGHKWLDPQGLPVDRCARIAKFCEAGTVLSSKEFGAMCSAYTWMDVGSTNMKGLGTVQVVQLGKATVKVEDTESIPVRELSELRQENESLRNRNEILRQARDTMAEECRKRDLAPVSVDDEEVEDESADAAWQEVETAVEKLKNLIAKSKVPRSQYARFIFLNLAGEGQTYNFYDNRFDEIKDRRLVKLQSGSENYYELDDNHPLNQKVFEAVSKLEHLLRTYEETYGRDEDHLFPYTLCNPDTWEEIVKVGVSI